MRLSCPHKEHIIVISIAVIICYICQNEAEWKKQQQ